MVRSSINVAGPQAVILVVAGLYFLAAVFCWTLPDVAATARANGQGTTVGETAAARSSRRSSSCARASRSSASNRSIAWSLLYLGITASLVGVLGVLGPDFAQIALGLRPRTSRSSSCRWAVGIVMGILLLNSYGKYLPRRRVIEGGLIVLGVMLALLSVAGPISQFLQRVDRAGDLLDLSAITSLLAIVVFIAFIAGIAYAAVAIPAQTQLQEDLPEDVRGRVFGVLNMLVSVSSFLPIIIVGPISDFIGTATVMLIVAIAVLLAGVASVLLRDPNLARPVRRPTRTSRIRSPRRSVPTDRRGADSRPPRPPNRRRPRRHPGRASGPADPARPGLSVARVAVVFTGGTISMGFDPVAGGNVPTLDGAAILARTPGLDAIADVVPIDRGLTPASHFTFADLLTLGRVIQEALDDEAIDGVVVVQGTDTIEETAFAWDLVAGLVQARRGDRGDARVARGRLRRTGQPAPGGRGGRLADAARCRRRGRRSPARSKRPTT